MKIDKTFIAKLGRNYQETALISFTVNFSHIVGLRVVAEGAEDDHQIRQLVKLG